MHSYRTLYSEDGRAGPANPTPAIAVMETPRLAAKGALNVSSILNLGTDALSQGGQEKIFSPSIFLTVENRLRRPGRLLVVLGLLFEMCPGV